MDDRERTIATYDHSAFELSEYFATREGHGEDIRRIFEQLDQNPRVLEIGCGSGREAAMLLELTSHYQGFDISQGMIEEARKRLPNADFEVADLATYQYPKDLDVVFSFASILHSDRDEASQLFRDVHEALKEDGYFHIATKISDGYERVIKDDQFGYRVFYHYSPELLKELASGRFIVDYQRFDRFGDTDWVSITFKKV